MSRKLYLDDEVVAALQDALKPMKGQSATLDRGINAVLALRRSTPKNWGYRTIDETGKVWDSTALNALPNGTVKYIYPGNQKARKALCDELSRHLGIGVVIERAEYPKYGGRALTPWVVWYVGK